jgi:putative aldouronate transport system substrate-binding protein
MKMFTRSKLLLAFGSVVVAGLALSQVGGAQSNLPPVELTYTYPGGVPKDLKAVSEALSVMTKRRFNATIKLEAIDWGAYDQKRSLAFGAGEKCDVVFTAPWINNFYRNVAQGNLLPLDDLLAKSPKLFKTLDASLWEAARVDGKIYGVINQQLFPKMWGFMVTKTFADKYKLNLNSIKRFEDLEPFLATIKKNEPGVVPFHGGSIFDPGRPELMGWDPIANQGVAVAYDDKSVKAFNVFETPELTRYVQLARKWYQLGYLTPQGTNQSDYEATIKAGKAAAIQNQWRPDQGPIFKARYGVDVVGKNFSPVFVSTSAINATMNGICATSANPERAMMFLELLNTDRNAYNLISKGIEGKHWNYLERAKGIIKTLPESGYAPGTDWMFGNAFNAFQVSEADVQLNRASQALNRSAKASAALGFTFDIENVKTEIAQLDAVIKEYGGPLFGGAVDPATGIAELQKRVKAAGIDRVVAEAQKQIDAWKAKNKK